jgi:2,3-dihydroxy-p-cumate/2,3-dihydroxybenzoate 3,4-dioxygenase
MQLRSIELEIPQARSAVDFLQQPWGLLPVAHEGNTTFLRATGAHHYVVSVTEGSERRFRSVTLTDTRERVEAMFEAAKRLGLPQSGWVEAFDEPGAGAGFVVAGHEGQPYRFLAEKEAPPAALPAERERPIQLAHVVFNTPDREASAQLLVRLAGFKVSDRSNRIHFVRCNELHHVIAFAASNRQTTINHIAFEMRDTDAVMRGMGRLKDAGCPTAWGPGRHGPGDNVFSYFVAPFGVCIEYTAEIERVDDSYPTGTPESWAWPAGRTDQWGIFTRDTDRLAASGEALPYAPVRPPTPA